jgi:serine/threonine protein kinase
MVFRDVTFLAAGPASERCRSAKSSAKEAFFVSPDADELRTTVPLPPQNVPAGDSVPTASDAERYEVLAELGRGGMGIVLKARQRDINKVVALKLLNSHFDSSSEARIRTEAEALGRLHHPNIVRVYGVDRLQGLLCIVMEYVEGTSLGELIQGVTQDVSFSVQTIATLGRAIHTAHETGLVHRDLKPSNVLVARNNVLKIVDFGVAKERDDPDWLRRQQEGTGAPELPLIGTPMYMAPEQAACLDHLVDPRTDVYALGLLLYEMLTGRVPCNGSTPEETRERILLHDPEPPRRLRPSIPRPLERTCLRCLQKKPWLRFSSALELADALSACIKRSWWKIW